MDINDSQNTNITPPQATQLKNKHYLTLIGVILFLFLYGFICYSIGIGYNNNKINTQNSISTKTTIPVVTAIPIKIDLSFKQGYIPNELLASYNAITSRSNSLTFTPLSCLRPTTDNTPLNQISFDEIFNSVHDYQLTNGLNSIKDHKFEYLAKSYIEENGIKRLDKQKLITTNAQIQIRSICNDNDEYIILFMATIPGDTIQEELLSLIPHIYAGGRSDVYLQYVSRINTKGEVEYFLLDNEAKPQVYTVISESSISQYGYSSKRRVDYTFPSRILGKINNNLFLVTETGCYECRDNPAERSFYSLSLNPLSAKEIAFCSNYEAPDQTCFDVNGKFFIKNPTGL